jgi:hypothetical protein
MTLGATGARFLNTLQLMLSVNGDLAAPTE